MKTVSQCERTQENLSKMDKGMREIIFAVFYVSFLFVFRILQQFKASCR